jgi:hypothetical protein
MPAEPPVEVADGLLFGRVYWMIGESAKGQAHRSVVDGPHLGWGQVFVIDKGGKLVTLFCPYSFEAHQVSRISAEYASLCRSPHEFRPDWHRANLLAKWEEACQNSWQRSFDVAAMVMRALGVEVPMLAIAAGSETKSTGGKEADVLGLLKPVKRAGRRGEVLAFFMAGENGARSIHEATAEFSITRSNLLSQLYLLQKEHGIGYVVKGDVAIVTLPAGCTDPFEG